MSALCPRGYRNGRPDVHRAPALDDDDWSIDTNIALFIFFFGSAPQLSLLFRRGATLEFRCRQVRGVLLQRLINDERATAGLHRLELIGSNRLGVSAAGKRSDFIFRNFYKRQWDSTVV